MFIHQQKAREVIEDLELKLKEAYREFRRRFGPYRNRLTILDIRFTGLINLSFTQNHKGELSMDISLKKGGTATAKFGGLDATGKAAPITALACTLTDTTDASEAVTDNGDGTFTVVITAVNDTTTPINVGVSAQDAQGDNLPPLSYTLGISDTPLAASIVNQTGWTVSNPA